jgi:predicted HAD superfamily Cof-like phosphohydrolase
MNDLLKDTIEWQRLARPVPTKHDFQISVGVHIEEFGEMLDALDCDMLGYSGLRSAIHNLAHQLKEGKCKVQENDALGLLDALADQIVTATGVGHVKGFQLYEALVEVNRANYSKFVDGKPVFDRNGKVQKGPDYVRPDLTSYV